MGWLGNIIKSLQKDPWEYEPIREYDIDLSSYEQKLIRDVFNKLVKKGILAYDDDIKSVDRLNGKLVILIIKPERPDVIYREFIIK